MTLYCWVMLWLCLLQSTVHSAPFSDLTTSAEAVRVVARAGLLSGYPDGTFRPSGQVTRAELVATALRLGGEVNTSNALSVSCFEDVAPRAWYADAVCRAREAGLVNGVSATQFAPEAAVTTAQALKTLLLASGLADETPGTPWYAPYVQRAEALGLNPPALSTTLTRDDLAQLLFAILRAKAVLQGEALPSSGCEAAGALPETLTVRGAERTFITSGFPGSALGVPKPQRLVFAFHGRTGTNEQVRRYYRLEPFVDTVFVYPNGSAPDPPAIWTDPEGDWDYALFDALLELFARESCVDLSRVFVVGHSLGASFANSLGCARGDKIRGVGSLGGGLSADPCRGKVAALVLHNPADRLVPVGEGERVRDQFLAQNGLEAVTPPSATEPAAFNCVGYGATLFPVVWCPHNFDYAYDGTYYPHNWPRNTGEVMMDFFAGL